MGYLLTGNPCETKIMSIVATTRVINDLFINYLKLIEVLTLDY